MNSVYNSIMTGLSEAIEDANEKEKKLKTEQTSCNGNSSEAVRSKRSAGD